ncbi:signal transduction histidine kinase [Catenuloplanes nepalensis]|uniref:histidine kinase n=1 Tax=Catenuloplanes nepalensis TaxID=587533 RepID=A0ABT9MWA3_9ACTN|nr:HAMP domain-containing sensor histidine kinase [Catenuloplanes nepalensis]MDP9795541.1 signal transduction histidine kinase [Catenuloplanes nepalensis]
MSIRWRLVLVCTGLILLTAIAYDNWWRLPAGASVLDDNCLNVWYDNMEYRDVANLCAQAQRFLPLRMFSPLLGTLVIAALCYPLLAYWVLLPLRTIVPAIAQMGPQNLGHRIRAPRRRRDEVSRLGHALDTMMDRIAAGYEGQRRFAANASHELRTPLALQRTLVEVGMAAPLTPEQSALLASQLLAANARNERLIEGLLVLSQADQGLAGRNPERLDTIVEAVLAAHAEPAAEREITLVPSVRPRTVHGDAVLLERLVRNLVHNAITYNVPGGTVHVTVGDEPALTVVNTGPPVPAAEVTRLFEPFTRLATDRIDHSGGSGLGLAIARSVVAAHDGTITARPEPSGGLRITVRFPRP